MSGEFSLHDFVRAVRDSSLDAEQSLVAYTIATYTKTVDCTTWVGTETLAKATRLSETTVRKVLQSLEASGVLVRVKGEDGGRTVRRVDTAAVATARPRERGQRQGSTPARATGVPLTGDPRTGCGAPPHAEAITPARADSDPRTGNTRSVLTTVLGSDQNTPPPPSGGPAAGEEEPRAATGLPDEGIPRPVDHAALEMMQLTQPGTERSPLFEPRPQDPVTERAPALPLPAASPPPAQATATTDREEPATPIPKWAKVKGHDPHVVLAAVVRAISAIRGRPVADPNRCATDAKHVLALQKATGTPWTELGEQVELVAEWARDSDDPLAARNIRGEGWEDQGGSDRSRSVDALCRQGKWLDRLEAAQRWRSRPKPEPEVYVPPYDPRTAPRIPRHSDEKLAEFARMREERRAREIAEREKRQAEVFAQLDARRLTMPPLVGSA